MKAPNKMGILPVSCADGIGFSAVTPSVITRFHVKNYKALKDVTIDLTPMHVLIGPNDSGKSSILEAVAALSRSTQLPLSEAFLGSREGPSLVWGCDATLPVTLRAEFFDSGHEGTSYEIVCQFAPASRDVMVLEETIRLAGGNAHRDSGRSGETSVRRDWSAGRDAEAHHRAKQLRELLACPGINKWDPKVLALPVVASNLPPFSIDSKGFGLAQCLDDILGEDRSLFQQIEKRFSSLFPSMLFKLKRCPASSSQTDASGHTSYPFSGNGKGVFFSAKPGSTELSASQVSDGILLALGYLALLHVPTAPRILLFEEPENGIHPQRLREVLGLLREMVDTHPGTQVLLTTHSPYALDQFKPEEVTLCRRAADGSVATVRLSESRVVQQQIDIFTLGEIWTAEGDDRLSEKAIGTEAPQA